MRRRGFLWRAVAAVFAPLDVGASDVPTVTGESTGILVPPHITEEIDRLRSNGCVMAELRYNSVAYTFADGTMEVHPLTRDGITS